MDKQRSSVSLFKQLLLAAPLFMMIMPSGNLVMTLKSFHNQSNSQLLSHTQDTATALGASLTSNVNDPAIIELMVNSVFDNGYYKKIRIVDLANGKVMLEYSIAATISNVPGWFIDLVDVASQTGEATIIHG